MDYEHLASPEAVNQTIQALKERGVDSLTVATGAEALQKINELIPAGASVMNGSSRTLEQIGFVDLLKSGTHGWNNLHAAVLEEKDPAKQATLRKQAVLSDYYLGSVHALAQTGEFVIASNSGSQLPHVVFTSPNLVLVVSTKKIVPTLAEAMQRLNEHVVPLEDARMKANGAPGTYPSKVLIFQREQAFTKRTVRVILVNENLGF